MLHLTLSERVENWNEHLAVDLENRLVQNVALAGQSSRNGYRYTDAALMAAAELYENKPVFLDHAVNRQRPQDRSTRDLVGSIVNSRFVNGRVRGDIRVLETESGQTFLQLVDSKTPGVGMSHVVLAERSADGKSVERISDVLSVDVVINPATTTTFSESTQPSVDEKLADGVAGSRSPEWTVLLAERDALLGQVTNLQTRLAALTTRDEVRYLIEKSGVPADAISECFHQQLINTESPLLREQLLQDRLRLLSSGRRDAVRVTSHSRWPTVARGIVEDEFVRVLKRR